MSSASIFRFFLLCIKRNGIVQLDQSTKIMILNELKFQNLLFLVEKFGVDNIRLFISRNKHITVDMIERTIGKNFWDYDCLFLTKKNNINFGNVVYLEQLLNIKKSYAFCGCDVTFDDFLSLAYNKNYVITTHFFPNSDITQKQTSLYFYKNIKIPPYSKDKHFFLYNLKEFSLEFVLTEVFEKQNFDMRERDWEVLSGITTFKEVIYLADNHPQFFKNHFCPNIRWTSICTNINNTFDDIIRLFKDGRFLDKISWDFVFQHAKITIDDLLEMLSTPNMNQLVELYYYFLKCLKEITFADYEKVFHQNKAFLKDFGGYSFYKCLRDINMNNIDKMLKMLIELDKLHFLFVVIAKSPFNVLKHLLDDPFIVEIMNRVNWGKVSKSNLSFGGIKIEDLKISDQLQWTLGEISENPHLTFNNIKELVCSSTFKGLKGELDWHILSRNKNIKLEDVLGTLDDKRFKWDFAQFRFIEDYEF